MRKLKEIIEYIDLRISQKDDVIFKSRFFGYRKDFIINSDWSNYKGKLVKENIVVSCYKNKVVISSKAHNVVKLYFYKDYDKKIHKMMMKHIKKYSLKNSRKYIRYLHDVLTIHCDQQKERKL